MVCLSLHVADTQWFSHSPSDRKPLPPDHPDYAESVKKEARKAAKEKAKEKKGGGSKKLPPTKV